MDSWEKIKVDLEEGMNIARKSAKFIADKAVTEAEVLKHRINIKSIESKINGLYRQMGETVYDELLKNTKNIEELECVKRDSEKIGELLAEREREESRIEEVRSEMQFDIDADSKESTAKESTAEEPVTEEATVEEPSGDVDEPDVENSCTSQEESSDVAGNSIDDSIDDDEKTSHENKKAEDGKAEDKQ